MEQHFIPPKCSFNTPKLHSSFSFYLIADDGGDTASNIDEGGSAHFAIAQVCYQTKPLLCITLHFGVIHIHWNLSWCFGEECVQFSLNSTFVQIIFVLPSY